MKGYVAAVINLFSSPLLTVLPTKVAFSVGFDGDLNQVIAQEKVGGNNVGLRPPFSPVPFGDLP